MTKKEKRLLIVKDALKQLRYTIVKKGEYCYGQVDYLNNPQADIKKIRKNCQVCAKGALFLSHIDKFNKVNKEDILYLPLSCFEDNICISVDNRLIVKKLNYFSEYQLKMIENAFECRYGNGLPSKTNLRCIKFGQKYTEPKERLRAILNNIILNDGLFKP